MKLNSFLGLEYVTYMKENHPSGFASGRAPFTYIEELHSMYSRMKQDTDTDRFCSIKNRGFHSNFNVTRLARSPGLQWQGASQSYKGLLIFKTPFDLQLYSSLLWELRPATIIEFGSLQGGSALWLADQLRTMEIDGHVHSFDMFDDAVHETAKNCRQISFHNIDLNDLNAIEEKVFRKLETLPRPWLVIDDCHVNLKYLIPKMSQIMQSGDYYVLEDIFLFSKIDYSMELVETIEKSGLMVDTKYTDAFGYNVTCAANGWLKKL